MARKVKKKEVKPLGFLKVSRRFFKDDNTENLVAFIVNKSKTQGINVGDYLVIRTGVQTEHGDKVCVTRGKEYVCGIRQDVVNEVSIMPDETLEAGTGIVIYPLSEKSKLKPFRVEEKQIFGKVEQFFKGIASLEKEL